MVDFRVAVEVILEDGGKILLTKRSEDCEVSPGVWSVPAGKAKYIEVPQQAVIREFKEETGLDVEIVKELDCHAATIKVGNEDAYRLFFVYQVKPAVPLAQQKLVLNNEHSEYAWVDKASFRDQKYSNLRAGMREIIEKHVL